MTRLEGFSATCSAPPFEFVYFGLKARYEISVDNSPRPPRRQRGDPACGMGEGFADFARRKQPLTPGFAAPSPLGEGRYQLRLRCESKWRLKAPPFESSPQHFFISPAGLRSRGLSAEPGPSARRPMVETDPARRITTNWQRFSTRRRFFLRSADSNGCNCIQLSTRAEESQLPGVLEGVRNKN